MDHSDAHRDAIGRYPTADSIVHGPVVLHAVRCFTKVSHSGQPSGGVAPDHCCHVDVYVMVGETEGWDGVNCDGRGRFQEAVQTGVVVCMVKGAWCVVCLLFFEGFKPNFFPAMAPTTEGVGVKPC